jgi:hypothetical protein
MSQTVSADLSTMVHGVMSWGHGATQRPGTCSCSDCASGSVQIDPAVTSGEDADETGIIVAGKRDGGGFVLADYSGRYPPIEWARRAIQLTEITPPTGSSLR